MLLRSSVKGKSIAAQPVKEIPARKVKREKKNKNFKFCNSMSGDERERDEMDVRMINNVRAAVTTPGSAITAQVLGNVFSVKGHHMQAIRDNQFDGVLRADPHKHLCDYEDLSSHFHYGPNITDAVRLTLFPLSLTREAKTLFKSLPAGSIATWALMKNKFVDRFFPAGIRKKVVVTNQRIYSI